MRKSVTLSTRSSRRLKMVSWVPLHRTTWSGSMRSWMRLATSPNLKLKTGNGSRTSLQTWILTPKSSTRRSRNETSSLTSARNLSGLAGKSRKKRPILLILRPYATSYSMRAKKNRLLTTWLGLKSEPPKVNSNSGRRTSRLMQMFSQRSARL